MNKKLLILSACLFACAASAQAQEFLVKLGGGMAARYGEARKVGAFKIGVGYEHEFDQHWTFSPSLVFYGKGWKDPDREVPVLDDAGNPVTDENGRPRTSVMGRSTSANYVELPLVFNYYLRTGESQYVVFSAGPYAAVGVSGKAKTKGDGERTGSEKLFYSGDTFGSGGSRRFDAGIQAGIGYQFMNSVTVGLEADFGLLTDGGSSSRNVSGLITVSYNFSLFR